MSVVLEPVAPEAPATVDDVSLLLETAAELIAEEGWMQHGTMGGPHCAVGAIGEAAGKFFKDDMLKFYQARNRLANYLGSWDHPKPGELIIEWNDTPGRGKQEVIRTLKEAAASGG